MTNLGHLSTSYVVVFVSIRRDQSKPRQCSMSLVVLRSSSDSHDCSHREDAAPHLRQARRVSSSTLANWIHLSQINFSPDQLPIKQESSRDLSYFETLIRFGWSVRRRMCLHEWIPNELQVPSLAPTCEFMCDSSCPLERELRNSCHRLARWTFRLIKTWAKGVFVRSCSIAVRCGN